MLTKNEIKLFSQLDKKKFRSEQNLYLIEGKRLFDEIIKSKTKIDTLMFTEDFQSENKEFVNNLINLSTRQELISLSTLKKFTNTETPQGIAGTLEIKSEVIDSSANTIIALENISDPGNLGTIFRNCEWFGVNNILLNSECVDVFNPKVIRSSMGSYFYLNVEVANNFINRLNELISEGYKIITADMNGETHYNFEFPEKSVLVFANEANGPSEELLKISTNRITIPKFGSIESLNVSNALSVVLAELKRS